MCILRIWSGDLGAHNWKLSMKLNSPLFFFKGPLVLPRCRPSVALLECSRSSISRCSIPNFSSKWSCAQMAQYKLKLCDTHVCVYLDHVGVRVRVCLFWVITCVFIWIMWVCVCVCVFVLGNHVCNYLDHACACVFFWVPQQ